MPRTLHRPITCNCFATWEIGVQRVTVSERMRLQKKSGHPEGHAARLRSAGLPCRGRNGCVTE